MLKIILSMFAVMGVLLPSASAQVDFNRSVAGLGDIQAMSDIPAVSAPVQDKGLFSWIFGGHQGGNAADQNTVRPPAPVREWTIMVFINAKNNLEAAGLYNVNEMERVGSTGDVNVVVEMGRMNGQQGDTSLDGNWTGSRRFLVRKDNDTRRITSPVLMTTPTVDMGDYRRVVDFVRWSKTQYPARRYMLFVWNHGSGWMDPAREQKGISFDDETGNYIRTAQVGQILKEAGNVDIVEFDACLMQMGEVAYELKDYTQVVVGSEETVPGIGFPYGVFLDAFTKSPAMSTEAAGELMVEAFKVFYDAVKKGAQLSAIRTSKLSGFAALVSDFARLAREVGDSGALVAARNGVIRYDCIGVESDPAMTISFYGDIYQYAGLVSANLTSTHARVPALKAKITELQNYIDQELVIANKASGKNRVGRELSESKGISVYLPPVETRIPQARLEGIFEGAYSAFAFDKVTAWHDFVTFLYGVR